MKLSKGRVIGFGLLYAALLAANLLSPEQTYSEEENRYLAERPALTWETLRKGEYDTDFEAYVSDQFFLRREWVRLSVEKEMRLRRREVNGVYSAPGGYWIEAFQSCDSERWEKNIRALADFAGRCQEQGWDTSVMLVPTASAVLSELVPAGAPEVDQEAMLAEAAERIPGFVDVSEALEAHTEEYIYYRTDHHWTSLGAFYAYQAWRGGIPKREDYEERVLSEQFLGTTYKKVLRRTAPDVITAFWPRETGALTLTYNLGDEMRTDFYDPSFLGGRDEYSVFLGGNQALIRMETGVTNGKKLLLVKDSYANCFAQFLLTDYEEIWILDLRHWNSPAFAFTEEQGITDVLVLYNLKGFAEEKSVFWLNQ